DCKLVRASGEFPRCAKGQTARLCLPQPAQDAADRTGVDENWKNRGQTRCLFGVVMCCHSLSGSLRACKTKVNGSTRFCAAKPVIHWEKLEKCERECKECRGPPFCLTKRNYLVLLNI